MLLGITQVPAPERTAPTMHFTMIVASRRTSHGHRGRDQERPQGRRNVLNERLHGSSRRQGSKKKSGASAHLPRHIMTSTPSCAGYVDVISIKGWLVYSVAQARVDGDRHSTVSFVARLLGLCPSQGHRDQRFGCVISPHSLADASQMQLTRTLTPFARLN